MPLETVGRYRVTGRGRPDHGGIRYPALDTLLGREVVIRTLSNSLAADPAVREHFLRQARHLARLRHPAIAALLDVVELEGRVYQVLPRERGRSLTSDFRHGRAPKEPDWVLRLAAGLCDGLSYVHAEHVFHGRVQPAFIFLGEEEEPILHGFEPDLGPGGFADPVLKVGTVVENARFLAPEAFRKEPLDARTDLWSLGATLFHLLTGRYPQERRDALGVMEETLDARPCPLLSALLPGVPAGVESLVAALLEKARDRRPESAEAVRSDLERLLAPARAPGGESAAARTVQLLGGGSGGLRRYAILEKAGAGGFGVVFRARERASGRPVALKILRPDLLEDERAVARMRREAEAARALDHPNIVRVLDAGRDADAFYVVMEMVEGPSLAERLRREGRFSWRESARITAGVLDALAHAHGRGVIHRDLKPSNVLLRGGETPVLLDFGIAHLAPATRLTRTGEVLGSPAYMSREQLEGAPADPRSDLYAAGVLLYEMLCGETPFNAPNIPALYRLVAEGNPRAPRDRGLDVPEALERFLLRLLSTEPGTRGEGAAAVAEELRLIAPPPAPQFG
ncbi:MAG: serine/threonine protein kinase [Planctomycetes bacterium]|nr:serine/threonine protein kinase [Planctomycetota bacterium]